MIQIEHPEKLVEKDEMHMTTVEDGIPVLSWSYWTPL